MTGNQTPYTEKYYAQITIIPNIIINENLKSNNIPALPEYLNCIW